MDPRRRGRTIRGYGPVPADQPGRKAGRVPGPLAIPPSEQGPLVIASAGGGAYGLGIAGRYASVAVGSSTYDFATIRQQREMYRSAVRQAGCDDEHLALQRVPMLGMMLGLHLDASHPDQPLTAAQLETARAIPGDPRSSRALEIARLRRSRIICRVRSRPGAADGFWLQQATYPIAGEFVDDVVPLLQNRGPFPAASPIVSSTSSAQLML